MEGFFLKALDTTLATKSDIREIRLDMAKIEVKLDKKLAPIKTDLAVLKWGMGLVIAGVAAQLVKLFVAS